MNKHLRSKNYAQAKAKLMWLFPAAIMLLTSASFATDIELSKLVLITILLVASIAGFVHTLLALKWQLIQTRFGTYYKAENPKKFNAMVLLSIVGFAVTSTMVTFLMLMFV
ncbi:hypothetical protein [Shewanella spartinae]|uniref:hypothetical protein n=1 Tax=Shewanella spartinae TaxID=2864205 RepID=UPI001C660AE8|nr:hypothetical protein [Shewanella spartinae]QYJ94538.1 hypothetical protein K0I31_03885 [Shewanella spartinae]